MSILSFHNLWDRRANQSSQLVLNKPYIKDLFPGSFKSLFVYRMIGSDHTGPVDRYLQMSTFTFKNAFAINKEDTLQYNYKTWYGIRRQRTITGEAFLNAVSMYEISKYALN